jgi:multidrug efflux pump subunit AcrA (membrane-fusion protein)
MQAEVRFPGIKSRRTPVILGKIRTVGADAMRDEANKDSYFLAIAEVRLADLPAQVAGSRMTAGMPVEVIVPTGERTVMDYWLAPLTDAATKTMREN